MRVHPTFGDSDFKNEDPNKMHSVGKRIYPRPKSCTKISRIKMPAFPARLKYDINVFSMVPLFSGNKTTKCMIVPGFVQGTVRGVKP